MAMDDAFAAHPDEVLVQGKAGDCLLYAHHLWHGGTCNTDGKPRRCLHLGFGRRARRQRNLRSTPPKHGEAEELLATLSEPQRVLMQLDPAPAASL